MSSKVRQAEIEKRSALSFTYEYGPDDDRQTIVIQPQDDLDGAFFLDHRNDGEAQVFAALIDELTSPEDMAKIRKLRSPEFRELMKRYSTWSQVTPPE